MQQHFPPAIIPVLDLRGGIVMHGRGGRRAEYRPLESRLVSGCEPAAVAQALVESFAPPALYVADLDAIDHERPQLDAIQSIAAAGTKLWLDAGIGSSCELGRLEPFLSRHDISADIVIGLESLASPMDLEDLLARLGPERTIFSLDLRLGKPITRIAGWEELSPLDIAELLIDQGLRRMILLDLAAVGMNDGVPTLELARDVRSLPGGNRLQLIGGGGVRSGADLTALAAAGFDAALVASALHDGRIPPAAT